MQRRISDDDRSSQYSSKALDFAWTFHSRRECRVMGEDQHGGRGQSEALQETRSARTIGEAGREQSREVWPNQIRTGSEQATFESGKRTLESASHQWRGASMKSPVVKRSIVVAGHKTSVSLEEAFWNGMKEISGLRDMTLSELVGEIDSNRQQGNLSSAIRLFVLDYFRTRSAQPQPSPDIKLQA
jgi:predicted DNA-binding ribbon-helix-helix protein